MTAAFKFEEHLSAAALACVDEAFGNVLATLLVGGRAVGLVRANSDVDLLVLTGKDDAPSLPFKFPTPDGVCEVEYHSARRLGERLSGFEEVLVGLASGASGYAEAKFLAETASRIRTGHAIAGQSPPMDALTTSAAALEAICARWVWFRFWMVETVLRLAARSAEGISGHFAPADLAGILFERCCRATLVELVVTHRAFYISGRYKWLGTLLTRHGHEEMWRYIRAARLHAEPARALAATDPVVAGLRAFAPHAVATPPFRLAPCPGGRIVTLTRREILVESADRHVHPLDEQLARAIAERRRVEDLTPNECARLIWVVPEVQAW
jgi:hypothetical protein